jgi:hypothetical protein
MCKVIISVGDGLLCEIIIIYTQYVVKKALGKYAYAYSVGAHIFSPYNRLYFRPVYTVFIAVTGTLHRRVK